MAPRRFADFRLETGAAEAVRRLRASGRLVFVVTNQPDVARRLLTPEDLGRMTEVLTAALDVNDVAICPHDDPDECVCRKPKPGMLLALAEKWDVDLGRSWVIGDSWKDIEAGRRAGCRTILLGRVGGGSGRPDRVVETLEDAVAIVESDTVGRGREQ